MSENLHCDKIAALINLILLQLTGHRSLQYMLHSRIECLPAMTQVLSSIRSQEDSFCFLRMHSHPPEM